jgi:hypothetical protein
MVRGTAIPVSFDRAHGSIDLKTRTPTVSLSYRAVDDSFDAGLE